VTLEKGVLRVFANEDGTGAPSLEVSLVDVEVCYHNATRETMHLPPVGPTELRVTVEPQALNRAIESGRASAVTPLGGFMNQAPQTTEYSSTAQRLTVALFAETAADKYAWAQILTSTAIGRRTWAHARYEAGVTIHGLRTIGKRNPH
jgi:hypothetical protein